MTSSTDTFLYFTKIPILNGNFGENLGVNQSEFLLIMGILAINLIE